MTKAFVIEGTMREAGDSFTAVVGVAFFPEGLNVKTLTGNMLENMGFRSAKRDRSLNFNHVTTNGGAPSTATLYFYDKSAKRGVVWKAQLDERDGSLTSKVSSKTEIRLSNGKNPRDIIPAITGPDAIRVGLADAKGALNVTDFCDSKLRPIMGKHGKTVAYAR